MSIEVTGPERYEFQYYVTLEFVLRFWRQKVRTIVDSGGEDATLEVEVDGRRVDLELQVKGSKDPRNAVDAVVLCDYLAHFPRRKSTDSLLERLLNFPDTTVIVVSTARAKEFCSPLVVREDWSGQPHTRRPFLAGDAKEFLSKVAAWTPEDSTQLWQKRREQFAALSTRTSPGVLNEAFRRLALQEGVTKEAVERRTLDHLRELGVPGDKLKGTLLRMLQCVRDSKGTGKDVVLELRELLANEVVPSVKPSDYVVRGNEATWLASLASDRALLLSGPPRCGKTDAARNVAASLQAMGFAVHRLALVVEAERILLDTGRADAVVVLDDPLGSDLESSKSAVRALNALDSLVRRLPPNRRLVVAQSQEVLLATKGVQSLDAVRTGGLCWEDLGKSPTGFLSRVWDKQCRLNHVPLNVRDAVAGAMASGEIDFPAGVLAHLANYHRDLQSAAVVRKAMSLASQSADDFAMLLGGGDGAPVVRALAIGSTAVECSADRELAFMLGQGDELEIPKPPYASVYSLGGVEEDAPTAPTYGSPPMLSNEARRELIKLERHRVLRRQGEDSFQFSHPFYRAAARSVVRRAVSMERDEVLEAVRRGLFAPSSTTSAAVARNLWWLYHDLAHSLGLAESLVDLADRGLHWHYPATRDLCYAFLLEVARLEPDEHAEKVQNWVERMKEIDIDDVEWDAVEPFFPAWKEKSFLSVLKTHPTPIEKRVWTTVEKLRQGDALPSAHEAVEALRFFRKIPGKLERDVALRLLNFGEGLIRAEVAYVWLSVGREDDESLLDRIQRDEHPSVVSRTLEAIIRAWPKCAAERQDRLANVLRAFNGQPETAAVVVLGLLGHFTDDDDVNPGARLSKPWQLVGEVLAPALKVYPASFRMAGTRLYDICGSAFKLLPSTPAAEIANAWIDWLELRISGGQLPDDYMLGLVPPLLAAPEMDKEARQLIVNRMLALNCTGAVLVFVADLVGGWNALRDEERDMVRAACGDSREDGVWLKAAALTQKQVPAEIQEVVLGAPDAFERPAAELVADLPAVLLTACLFMHRGSPQPLWYLGHHHDDSPQWKEVIRHLARSPRHPLFEECVCELIAMESRYGKDELTQVIQSLDAASRMRVFHLLLDRKAGVVAEWHQREFDLLLELAGDQASRDLMVEQIVAKSPQILEKLSDILDWTHRTEVREALLGNFESDCRLFTLWARFKDLEFEEDSLRDQCVEMLVAFAESNPPRLPDTLWKLGAWLKSMKAGGRFIARAEQVRKAVVATFSAVRFSDVGSPPCRFLNWVGPN